nr:MAG TPA: hypothetical protein [Caudoviricetes sp.]
MRESKIKTHGISRTHIIELLITTGLLLLKNDLSILHRSEPRSLSSI